MPNPLQKGLTLRGLEVFEALAQTGSVAETADRLGMSAPAVSQQLKNLSQALGVELVDHSRRPMMLTAAGRVFLAPARTALDALRAGQRGVLGLELGDLAALTLGVIEDFENEVTPRLTTKLAAGMRDGTFRLTTGPSHLLQAQITRRELDIAICAEGTHEPEGVFTIPLLADPYVLAVPQGTDMGAGLSGLSDLAFLWRDTEQLMGQQIEAYVTQAGLHLSRRFEMDSNQSLTALVASRTGWTVTTLLSLLRAGRFVSDIDVHPLPGQSLSRKIVLHATEDWGAAIPGQIADLARESISEHVVERAAETIPVTGVRFSIL